MSERPLLGLTLHRPWPVLIARGIKRIENRSWHPEPRLQPGEWFAIHVGRKYDHRCTPMAVSLGYPIETFFGQPANTEQTIVAVAQYGGYVRGSEDPWFFGPVGWLLPQVVAIEPVKCKGAQGLWRVPQEIADQVREAYRKATTGGAVSAA